ncbi:glycoside hydrolase family 15 protein [Streptomyces europaeiscabiei]|uniref:glycoside hydrolase family 15 protein n=1 Tax=Streptomyces europaeiscabiei TaxID=146819 RepID=UPI0029BB83A3|nr:glycoside hydrolase family 15 protein [Streptomyces europaeiscabiei]MDX3694824.1 glycoside hydrolase family 15 protein [Streptomyces europaeiscabiei]
MTSRHIEDYALIGDMQTATLVRRDGTADWLCLPRFDSSAVFAGLLGTEEHGYWRVGPACDTDEPRPAAARRRYRGDSLVLEMEWDTPTGTVRVVDFMPARDGHAPQLIRIVEGVSGRVAMRSALRMSFGYGRVTPWLQRIDGRPVAVAGPDAMWLDTDAETYSDGKTTFADFTVSPGERVAFTLTWQSAHTPSAPSKPDPEEELESVEKFWADWVGQCSYDGPWRESVIRSLITLKALTYAPTGGIVAAPTTSLPEEVGGVRNWDYRFCWLRDSAITLNALLRTGYRGEARAWRNWLLKAVAGDPDELQIMYSILGERDLTERELPWLPGFEDSAPVRVGNGAAHQLQLDVYGEVCEALFVAHESGLAPCGDTAALQLRLVTHLKDQWNQPDEGIWEVRGPRQHFVHSKVMAWVAVDRTIKLIQAGVMPSVELDELLELRDAIHHDVCTKGYDRNRNTFTQSYGSDELDASLLLIPRVGFLPPDDPRVIGTVDAVRRELSTPQGFVQRYPTEGAQEGLDGLPGDEGTFLICSFWMVDALALTERLDQARDLFERLLTLCNDLGLLAEEYDPVAGQQLGNFPQAFSHIGLVDSAILLHQLERAKAPVMAA